MMQQPFVKMIQKAKIDFGIICHAHNCIVRFFLEKVKRVEIFFHPYTQNQSSNLEVCKVIHDFAHWDQKGSGHISPSRVEVGCKQCSMSSIGS